jgi:hypothetical protein
MGGAQWDGMERGDKKRKGKYKMKKESNGMSISVTWHIADVLDVRPDLDSEQAFEVLRSVKKNHDANVGINWEVLSATAEVLYGEKIGKNE